MRLLFAGVVAAGAAGAEAQTRTLADEALEISRCKTVYTFSAHHDKERGVTRETVGKDPIKTASFDFYHTLRLLPREQADVIRGIAKEEETTILTQLLEEAYTAKGEGEEATTAFDARVEELRKACDVARSQ